MTATRHPSRGGHRQEIRGIAAGIAQDAHQRVFVTTAESWHRTMEPERWEALHYVALHFFFQKMPFSSISGLSETLGFHYS